LYQRFQDEWAQPTPNVARVVAAPARIVEVGRKKLVVGGRSRRNGPQIAHTVEVGDVDLSGVRRRAVRAVLLHKERKEAHVCSVEALEEKHNALAVRVLARVLKTLTAVTGSTRC
jgi:hypothetical protein